MNAGDVVLDTSFRLQNGVISPKYLILLNIHDDDFCIFCLTTSDPKSDCDQNTRCNSESGHFYIGKYQNILRDETWLYFPPLPSFKKDTVLERIISGELINKGCIDDNLVRQIKNCIARSNVSKYLVDFIRN